MYAYAFNLSKKENNSKNFSANYKPFSNFELKEFFFERCCLRKQRIYKLRSSYEVELWRHSFPEFIPSHVVILNVTISNIPNTYLQKKNIYKILIFAKKINSCNDIFTSSNTLFQQ